MHEQLLNIFIFHFKARETKSYSDMLCNNINGSCKNTVFKNILKNCKY